MKSMTDLLNAAAAALAELAQAVSDAQTMQDTAADWLQPESEAEAQRHLLEVRAEAAYLLEGEESEFASAEGEAE